MKDENLLARRESNPQSAWMPIRFTRHQLYDTKRASMPPVSVAVTTYCTSVDVPRWTWRLHYYGKKQKDPEEKSGAPGRQNEESAHANE